MTATARTPAEPVRGDVVAKTGRDNLRRQRTVLEVTSDSVIYTDHKWAACEILLPSWVAWVRGRGEYHCDDPNPAVFITRGLPTS